MVPRVAHHSDDLEVFARRRSVEAEALADGILVREETSRHALADDGYPWRILSIRSGEIAAQELSNTHQMEKARTYKIVVNSRNRATCKRPSVDSAAAGVRALHPYVLFRTRDELPIPGQRG